jgi:branched-chain amino acid transport system ATP-binding protein
MPRGAGLSLQVAGLSAGYHGSSVLQAVDLDVPAGMVCAVLGPNGAGKTTLIHAVMGIGQARTTGGRIRVDAGQGLRDITRWAAHRRARLGMALVPQGRRVFAGLTVAEHLKLLRGPTTVARAVRQRADRDRVWTVERLVTVFPQLGQRLTTAGGHLSGGEQQMLAIARALLTQPRLLLLDEPTEGLSPPMAQRVATVIGQLAADGVAVLLATPDVPLAVSVADHVHVLAGGRLSARFDGTDLRADPGPLHAALDPTGAPAPDPAGVSASPAIRACTRATTPETRAAGAGTCTLPHDQGADR